MVLYFAGLPVKRSSDGFQSPSKNTLTPELSLMQLNFSLRSPHSHVLRKPHGVTTNTIIHLNYWSELNVLLFISKLWAGRTSDRKIVQESGLIDLLEKGDHLMADRGFNIRDLTRRGVKLNIPPFSKGRFANSTYHTSKKAKELALLTNTEPLSPPKHKPPPFLHFRQQMCTITCSTFLLYCHYFNFLHLSFVVVVVSQGNSCLEKEGQQHQALPKSENF